MYTHIENQVKETQLKDMFYQSLFIHNPNASYLLDMNGNFVSFNEEVEVITGYSKSELLSMDFWPLFNDEDKPILLEKFTTTLAGQKNKFKTTLVQKTGTEIIISVTCVPVIIDGIVEGIVGIAEDITEEEQTKIRNEKELHLAQKLQLNVLPKPISNTSIEIDGVYIPCDELSGDMYYWQKLINERYAVVIFDVMGHGVSSSLIGMTICSMFRELITMKEDPVEIFTYLNEHIYDLFQSSNQPTTYVTGVLVIIDCQNNSIEYVNAGHVSPVLFSKSLSEPLPSLNLPLGLSNRATYEKKEMSYNKHSRLVLYTDGLVDSLECDPDKYIAELATTMQDHEHLSNEHFIKYLKNKKDKIPEIDKVDDICLVSITIKK
ncbi:SpoIIE family protein phosphatase [Bacillus alkalicellulosilyticus]|uniref:SpoIIE family protein phosphatase n=1 Tax=Alkalihalobacterium alkalicellulosilyticum TaxID=1912214 RepID=UPI001483CC79|nr:SpoIIE family protein phosphatase [Bacillus alkalicellulosilyticus]